MALKPIDPRGVVRRRNLLQSRFWARLKEEMGWEVLGFEWTPPEGRTPAIPCLVYLSPPMAYLPWAPDMPSASVPEGARGLLLEALSRELLPRLPEEILFIRYDLPWDSPFSPAEEPLPPDRFREIRMNFGTRTKGLRKAPSNILPAHSVELDLAGPAGKLRPEEELLAEMKPKTRYNIGLARRRGVRVQEKSPEELPRWYAMYERMARAKGLAGADYAPFRAMMEVDRREGMPETEIKLLLAEKEGEPVGGVMVALHREQAVYFYGATRPDKRRLMPGYLLQWRAIREARAARCRTYDLFGIPPRKESGHPMAGLYRFKTGFGGRRVDRQGCWDYPRDEEAYQAYAARSRADSGYYR